MAVSAYLIICRDGVSSQTGFCFSPICATTSLITRLTSSSSSKFGVDKCFSSQAVKTPVIIRSQTKFPLRYIRQLDNRIKLLAKSQHFSTVSRNRFAIANQNHYHVCESRRKQNCLERMRTESIFVLPRRLPSLQNVRTLLWVHVR